MNRDLIRAIERNLADLRYSVEFDRYDFSPAEQDAMLMHVDAVSKIVEDVKRRG